MIACNSLFAPPLSPACVPISMLAKASRVEAGLQAANEHCDSPHKYPGQTCLRSRRESIKQINEAARAKLWFNAHLFFSVLQDAATWPPSCTRKRNGSGVLTGIKTWSLSNLYEELERFNCFVKTVQRTGKLYHFPQIWTLSTSGSNWTHN